MRIALRARANDDLDDAFDYYQEQRLGLGDEFLEDFRRGVDCILENPLAWQSLDATRRRYRLHRFPYGLIYRIEHERIIILAVMHLSRYPR